MKYDPTIYAFRSVVLRADLEEAERFTDPSRSPGGCREGVDVERGDLTLQGAAGSVSVTLQITDSPSRSKGWGRAKLTGPTGPVITSNTGNEWVGGAPIYTGSATEGDELQLTLECMLNVGQSQGTRREERSAETYRLIASPCAAAHVVFRPGSQGITVEITGAELV